MEAGDSSGDHSGSPSSWQPSSEGQPRPGPPRRAGGNASRANGRSRPRASLACMNCRQRKIKCNFPSDAAGPGPGASCTSCRSLQIACVVSADGDRRKTGSREQVAALQDRLQFLESFIARGHVDGRPTGQGLDIPEEGQNHLDSSGAVSAFAPTNQGADPMLQSPSQISLHLNALPISNASGSAQNVDAGTVRRLSSPLNRSPRPGFGTTGEPGFQLDSSVTPETHSNGGSSSTNNPNNNSQRHPDHYASSSSTEFYTAGRLQTDLGRLTPPREKDGSRLEVDENHGRPRFYGPTSQLYIHRRSFADPSDSPGRYDEQGAALNIDSAPLRALLFHTFWRIQPSSVVIVDQAFFEAGRESIGRSEYYSPFLEHTILACATRMSTSEAVRTLGAQYADRAKAETAVELENPNIATLQGFLMLSDFEATRGRDRLGYMYCGIACRLVFDLGLAESCDHLVTQGKLSASEALSRHTLFLGTFVFDKLWSLYLGRPGAIPVSILEAAHERWLASGWSGPPTLGPWVGLCVDMSAVSDILNNSSLIDFATRQRLADLDRRIRHRSEALPPSLILHENDLAQLPVNAYGLHIQFFGLRIVLHRLLCQNTSRETTGEDSSGIPSPDNNQLDQSRTIMHDSAVRIARLVSAYLQVCGIENAITVMLDNVYVAAAVLIPHLLGLLPHDNSPATHRDLHWLRSLADMLHKAQKHYPVTARMRATLSSFVENTSLAGMFGTFARPVDAPRDASAVAMSQAGGVSEMIPTLANPNMDRRQDVEMFEDCFGEDGDRVFQDMDLRNMMSWVLGPTLDKEGDQFQV